MRSDGFQVLELLKARKAEHDTKVVVVSGFLDDATKAQLSKTVADSSLDKLTDINTLVKTIVDLLRSGKTTPG
jgi:DNA-binding response OmpR family regulator